MTYLTRCIVALLVPVLAATGCVRTPEVPGAAVSAAVPGRDLSAEYFYLKSRRLFNRGETVGAAQALEKAVEKDPESSFLKREQIVLLHKLKRSDQALALAEKLAAQEPDNVDNLMLLVRLKKGGEYNREMSGLLKRILDLDPENRETYLRLGKIYLDTEQPDEALTLFTKMTEVFPDYYVAHFYHGEALLNAGEAEKAEAAFRKTLELEPELVEPRFRLADIYRETGRDEYRNRMFSTFGEILELEPDNDRARLELALLHHKNNQADKADPLFALLNQSLQDNPGLIMTAVDAFISRKRYADAVIVFSQLRKLAPANANLNFFLGMAHEALEEADKAIQYYLKVTPDHPQYKKTILSIAFLYREKGNTREALRFLEQRRRQSPADIDIISYLASFYEEDTRYDTAMTLLQKGLKLAPENTTLLFKLGAIQDKAGLRQDCINTMKALIRLDPEHASALNYLGYTYAEMGIHLDEALDLVRRALKIRPKDGYITDSLGWIYFKRGEYDKAVHHLEQAAEISNFETIIADHLGDAYLKAGRPADALTAYEKALANGDEEAHKKEIRAIRKKINDLKARGHGQD